MKTRFLPIVLFSLLYLTTTLTLGANNRFDVFQNDSIKERRDEYFKGVQIIIDDKPANVSINKPYEKLTDKEKEYYLSNIPENKNDWSITESDFNSFTRSKDAPYFLDNKQTTLVEILKHNRDYYACAGLKRAGTIYSYYFFTYPYFEKNIKPIYDHYPDKIYKITILNEALENVPVEENLVPANPTYQRNGRSQDEEYNASIGALSYGYTDEITARSREIMAHYPGGNDKFNDYLFANIKIPDNLKQQQIEVTFVINTNGKLSDIFLSDDLDPALAAEVRRVMETSPRWIPAQRNGGPYMLGTRLYFKNK